MVRALMRASRSVQSVRECREKCILISIVNDQAVA